MLITDHVDCHTMIPRVEFIILDSFSPANWTQCAIRLFKRPLITTTKGIESRPTQSGAWSTLGCGNVFVVHRSGMFSKSSDVSGVALVPTTLKGRLNVRLDTQVSQPHNVGGITERTN